MIFGMEVHYYEDKKRAQRFAGKNLVFPKWALKWYFRGLMAQNGPSNRVIPILLENGSKDFSDFLHEVRALCKGMGFDLFMFVLLLYTGLYIDGLYIFCI